MRDIITIDFDCRLNFSGHKEGPKAYKKWRKAMEDWFFFYNIPNHKKVRYAEKTLIGEASKWWEDELEMVDYYSEPDHSWLSMNFLMYEEFFKNATSQEPTKQVSRTKLFEEGENDEGSESAEKTPEHHSANTNPKINLENSGDNFPIFLGHEESSSKWNHLNPSSHKEIMNFTNDKNCNISGLDQHALLEAPRSNQEDSNCKPACYGILTQKESCETWNQTKSKLEEEDIQVTSQPDSDFADSDLLALIGVSQSDQSELSDKSSCFGILTNKGRFENLNHINQNYYEGVMDFSIQGNLHLPYLEAHEFERSQRCDWRPEEYLNQLEASKKSPRCILIHWIIGFQYHSIIHQDLPYLDKRGYNSIQRLLSWSRLDMHEFGSIYTSRRPSIHGYIILISRYKGHVKERDQDIEFMIHNIYYIWHVYIFHIFSLVLGSSCTSLYIATVNLL